MQRMDHEDGSLRERPAPQLSAKMHGENSSCLIFESLETLGDLPHTYGLKLGGRWRTKAPVESCNEVC